MVIGRGSAIPNIAREASENNVVNIRYLSCTSNQIEAGEEYQFVVNIAQQPRWCKALPALASHKQSGRGFALGSCFYSQPPRG